MCSFPILQVKVPWYHNRYLKDYLVIYIIFSIPSLISKYIENLICIPRRYFSLTLPYLSSISCLLFLYLFSVSISQPFCQIAYLSIILSLFYVYHHARVSYLWKYLLNSKVVFIPHIVWCLVLWIKIGCHWFKQIYIPYRPQTELERKRK